MIKKVTIPKAQYTKTSITNLNRNVGLDFARALCVILVIISHTNNYMGNFTVAFKFIFPIGYVIQDLFFALSGFLIGAQILKHVNSSGSLFNLLVFYKNRWVRTIPFYFIFLIINYLMFCFVYNHSKLNFFFNDFHLKDYFLFTQNLAGRHPTFFPEIWPLPIEEWSFLLLPIPILLYRYVAKKPLTKKQVIILLSVELIVANFVRIFHVAYNDLQTDWDLRKVVLFRMDALIYGFLIRMLMDQYVAYFSKYKIILFLLGFTFSIAFYFTTPFLNLKIYQMLLFFLVPAFMSLTLPFFFIEPFRFLKKKLAAMLTHISLISYSVLLSHLYLIQFSLLNFYTPENFFQGLLFTLVYFSILLVFSTTFFNFVERPILLLRKK
ncbi:acyltransferase family protein [Aurantibacillus circumpalustris]|uniref:acyltransferase family protein n=1 Tax=Aurantibacillus circumpalustris TaxID=3036359 RepID=UPI00295B57EF|nr:acyltransferase [Aurantibacillus circumpalustris]